MIKGIGVDIIEVHRIQKLIDKGQIALDLVFTIEEQIYCKKSGIQSYAGRYAAKEAFLKALGTGWIEDLNYSDIEILNDEKGKPYIRLYNSTKNKFDNIANIIHLSISHIKEIATAYVIIEHINE